MNKGDRVKVDFVSESATIYSGKRFTGYGVLDRVEDGRVFGRLDDGTPFMCLCTDVEVVGMNDVDSTLNERGARYGNYSDVASTTQQLMSIVECGANYEHLNAEQKTSLFMICNKIARAVNGDPNYIENWHDIAGYSTLIENSLMTTEGATNAKIVAQRVVNGVMGDI